MGKLTMKGREELLRLGLPVKLSKLRHMLDGLDDAPDTAVVDVFAGQLRVHAPERTLLDDTAGQAEE